MTNPYKVLGVPENAEMDEIKKQYRALSRKYHPDANVNNPDRDKAEEKFKEIQAAYAKIVEDREKGIYGGYDEGRSSGNANSSYSDPFAGFGFGGFGFGGFQDRRKAADEADSIYVQAAANYINSGRFREALSALSNVPSEERSAKWYYYSAIANSRMGNNVAGMEHAKQAYRMEPSNAEYTSLVRMFESGGKWYADTAGDYGGLNLGSVGTCMVCGFIQFCCSGGCFCCI